MSFDDETKWVGVRRTGDSGDAIIPTEDTGTHTNPEKFKTDNGFSEQKSVSNAVAPGDLIRSTTSDKTVYVRDISIYNADANAALITFYDQDSKVYDIFKVGAGQTAVINYDIGLKYINKHIYARTDQATNSEITICGLEVD